MKKLIIILLIVPVLGFGQTGSQTGYYFHGGQNNYPANADLTAGGEQIYYYDPGSGFTQTSDFDVAMSYVMDNMGTMGNGYGSEYEILTFDIPQHGITALGNSDELIFPVNDTAERYYIILPDGQVDLTDANQMHLYNPNGGANTNIGTPRKSFTWNGQLYWIYKTGFQGSTASRTLAFNNNDYEDRIYWLHWSSNAGYPISSSLIVEPTGGWYLNNNSQTSNFDLIWNDMIIYQGTPNNVPVIESFTALGSNFSKSSIPDGTIGFDAIANANRYYIAIPVSWDGDPTQEPLFVLPDSVNAQLIFGGKMSFNIDGVAYWLYDIGLTASTDGLNLNLKFDNPQTASVEKHAKAITVYPNPTSSTIEVQQEFSVAKIYSITGQELLKSNSKTIDLSELPSSVYLLRLYDDSNKVLGTTKVMKH